MNSPRVSALLFFALIALGCGNVIAAKPAGIDGQSFRPVLTGSTKTVRNELFLADRDVHRAWRDDRGRLKESQAKFSDTLPLTVPDSMFAKWTPPSAEEIAKQKAAK